MAAFLLAESREPGWFSQLVACFIIAFAVWQFRAQLDKFLRPEVYFGSESDRERRFLKRQSFRRAQIGALAGLFGVFMLIGLWTSTGFYPRAWALSWCAALVFLVWACCLAGVDVVSIRLHYGPELDRTRAEKLALDYKVKKFRESSLQELENAKREEDECEANERERFDDASEEQNEVSKVSEE